MPFYLAWFNKLNKGAAVSLTTVAALIFMLYYMKHTIYFNTVRTKGKLVI